MVTLKRPASLFVCLLVSALTPLFAQTTVTLTATPNPSRFGAPVTLAAAVTPSGSTGTVTFYDGVTILGTKTLSSGAASLSTIALPSGTRQLRAYYAGTTSNVVTQGVNAQASASFAARSLLSSTVTAVFAVADFNADGRPDLAVNDGSASTIGVLLGTAGGGFQAAPNINAGATVNSAAVSDFNGDGKLDLVATTSLGNAFKILLGNGDGAFKRFPIRRFRAPSSVSVADFNGDGKADLLILNGGGASILSGNGDGTFQAPVIAPPGATVFTAVTGDFNGDSKTDLAVAFGTAGGPNLSILLGKGDGTFQQGASYPIGGYPAAGDFNGDGKSDLAVTQNAGGARSVVILPGNGDGTFQTGMTFAIGAGSSAAVVGDWNGDGKADLAFAVSDGSQMIVTLPGNGDGAFQPAVNYRTGFDTSSLIAGEFNGDGRTDLVLKDGNFLMGTTVSITPAGTPQSTVFETAFPAPLQITLKDGATPISGVPVTFTAPSSGTSAMLSNSTAVTDANGVATVTATANLHAGSYTVTATAAALGVSTAFSLTNLAGPPSTITASPASPQSTMLGSAFPKPLQVTIKGPGNLPASGVAVTFTAPGSGASAALSAATVLTDAAGVASINATANSIRGSYAVRATAGPLTVTFPMVNLQTATVGLATSANPSTFGSPLVLTATVAGAPFTGKVTFYDGVALLGTKPVISGTAFISTIALAAGTHRLTAYYRDDANFVAGASNALSETVKTNAAAALVAQPPILRASPTSFVLGDFNGDGKADFAYASNATIPSWWQVDLGTSTPVGSVVIWNRTDCCGDRLRDYWVFVSDTPFGVSDTPDTLKTRAGTFSSHQTTAPNPSAAISAGGAQGRYVRVQLSTQNYLSLAEVQVFGIGAQAAVIDLALGKPATQSSTYPGDGTGAASAVDGNTDGNFFNRSVSTTSLYGASVLLGKGDGIFQAPVPVAYGIETPALSIASGDFNGDGNIDLAIFGIIGQFPVIGGIDILLGNGDGTFRPAVEYSAGALATGINLPAITTGMAVGDFNGDGKADVVLGFSYSSSNFSLAKLLPGKGDGTFGDSVSYPAVSSPFIEADFNGDGFPDIAGWSPAVIEPNPRVVLGNGDGVAPGSGFASGGKSLRLVPGDFNGDGKVDLAASNSLFLGNGDGSFQPAAQLSSGGVTAAGDFNGDGILDLVVSDATFPGILLGNGDGTFRQGTGIPPFGTALAIADFNGDGRADILYSSAGSVYVLLGATSSTFTITATGGTPQSTSVGSPFGTPLQVTVLNNGVPAPGVAVTFATPTTGASATFSPATATTNAAGVASVNATANSVAGSYTVTATSNGMTASFALTNTVYAFLTATSGTPQSTVVRTAFPNPLQATVKDALGNPVSGVTVTFAAPTVGPSAALSGATAVTNASGVASITATANDIAGSYSVVASVGSLTAQFALTNGSAQVASITATGGTPQSARVGSPFATPLQVTAKDALGNPVSGVTVSFSAPTVGPSAILSAANALTDASGMASVTARPNITVGSYAVTASASGLSTSFALNNTTTERDNLALHRSASQSSTLAGYPGVAASSAVDGNTDGNFYGNSVTATDLEANPWWQVDLGVSSTVDMIRLYNRTDCCGDRLADLWVFVSDTPFLAGDTPSTLLNRAGTFAAHLDSVPLIANLLVGSIQGRYVRVQLTGTNYLSLAEVVIFGTAGGPVPINIAQGKPAAQSSTLAGFSTVAASSAVDGSTNGSFYGGSVTATNEEANPWWQVDLGASASINSVVVWNRTDCCASRLKDYWVFISDTPFLPGDTPATLQNRAGTLALHKTTAPDPYESINVNAQGRYVRIQLTGANFLSLAEVQAFGTGGAPAPTLVSQGKPATQSSTLAGYSTTGASSAIDGNTDGAFFSGSVTATIEEANPWWQVDLGSSTAVSSITIWNRTDCCASRLTDYWVFVSDTPFAPTDTPATLQNRAGTFASHQTTAPAPSVPIPVGAQGRYVRVQLSGQNFLSLAEVQVYGQ